MDRAAHAAAARFLSPDATPASITEWLSKVSLSSRREKFELNSQDFETAQENFVPSAMQGIAKGGNEVGRSGWDDVGGLLETRRALQEVSNLPHSILALLTTLILITVDHNNGFLSASTFYF